MNQDNHGRFKKGIVPWNKGKKNIYSKETLDIMRISHIGKKASEETRKKMSFSNKGRPCHPNSRFKKGHTINKGVVSKRKGIPYPLAKGNKYRVGIPPWNKGIKTGLVPKTAFKRGFIPWSKGKHLSEETKQKIRESIKRSNFVVPKKDTSIEVKIQNFLRELKIKYLTHCAMDITHVYKCDIFIPVQELDYFIIKKPVIIECDGDYWHGNPNKYSKDKLNKRQIKKKYLDNLRNQELNKKGFKVIRLWEYDINKMTLKEFLECLILQQDGSILYLDGGYQKYNQEQINLIRKNLL